MGNSLEEAMRPVREADWEGLSPLEQWRLDNPDHVSAKPRTPTERWQDKDTRATAIAAFCYQCMGESRTEIRNCTAGPDSILPCPLWNWRPYK